MNTTQTHHGSGNWVVFLTGAIFNMIVSISYEGLIEYALYSVIGSTIAGGIWLLYKKLGEKLGAGSKKDPIDKLIDKQEQNVKQ